MIRRLAVCVTLIAVLAIVVTAAALAWSQTYVSAATWGPGSMDNSAYNSSLKGNVVSFDNRYGGTPYMGTTFIDSNGNALVAYRWENDGYILDDRNISYGAARCRASGDNNYSVYVSYCYTNN